MIPTSSTLTILIEQTRTAFLAALTHRKNPFLACRKEEIYAEVFELMEAMMENALHQPDDEAYEQMLILCCLERPALFTTAPDLLEYVTDDERKPVTAEQCVYQNLREYLQWQLERAFEHWYDEQRPESVSTCELLSEVTAKLVENGDVELSAVPVPLAEIPDEEFPDGGVKKGIVKAYRYTLAHEGKTMQGYWFGSHTLKPPTLPVLLCNLMLSCFETRDLHHITDHSGGYAMMLRYVLGDALLYRLLGTEWDI